MKIKSRILALLLAVVMCMTTLATTAFAYADDPEDSTIPTSVAYSPVSINLI